jgi:hypothetical protein
VLTLGLALIVSHMLAGPGAPVLEPESASYLEGLSFRPGGYPLLLHLIGAEGAYAVQPILAALAITWLGVEVLFATRSALAAGATMLAIALNPFTLAYHFRILPDSLYVSLLMVQLGLIVRFVRKGTLPPILAASVVAGMMIALRTSGWFMLPVLALAALTVRSRIHYSRTLFAAAVLPLVLIAGADTGARALLHPGEPVTLLSHALYGKAGLIDAPAPEPQSPAASVLAASSLERAFAPVRELIAQSPGGAIARYLTANYETCIAYACASLLGVDPASPEARAAARARILANPAGFLRIVWRDYRALWSPFGPARPDAEPAANAFLDAHRPLPFEEQAVVLTQTIKPVALSAAIEPALLLVGIITGILALGGLAAAARRLALPTTLAIATIAAFAVQSQFSLAALTGAGLPRTTLLMWPAMTLALVAWGAALVLWLKSDLKLPQLAKPAAESAPAVKPVPVVAPMTPIDVAEQRAAHLRRKAEQQLLMELAPLTHPDQLKPPPAPAEAAPREPVPKEVLAQISAVPIPAVAGKAVKPSAAKEKHGEKHGADAPLLPAAHPASHAGASAHTNSADGAQLVLPLSYQAGIEARPLPIADAIPVEPPVSTLKIEIAKDEPREKAEKPTAAKAAAVVEAIESEIRKRKLPAE